MVSVNRRTLYGEVFNDVRCLSSDEKPTEGIKNGSTLIEIDTGARYLFDASNGQWNEFSQGGGGDYVLPTMSPTTKGGATVGDGLTMDGTALSVDYSEVASVDALEGATALSPTGGIVSTQDGLAISPEQSSMGAIDGALLELTAKSKPATQVTTDDPPSPSPDYPQEIVTVCGRNLLEPSETIDSRLTRNSDGSITVNTVPSANFLTQVGTYTLKGGKTYTLSGGISNRMRLYTTVDGVTKASMNEPVTFTPAADQSIVVRCVIETGAIVNSVLYPQLTEGSTPQPYVPYGHVGLERRDSQGTLLDTTPIPLPSRGWVAGLPDGTADELTVDGAGKVVWTEKTYSRTYSSDESYYNINGMISKTPDEGYKPRGYSSLNFVPEILCTHFVKRSSNQINDGAVGVSYSYNGASITFSDGTFAMTATDFKALLAESPLTVLYPLMDSVTHDCGYIDLPDMQDCVLSIPELDALGVRYTIGDGAEIARQWHERNEFEVAAATTEALGNVAPVEGDTASANYAVGNYLVHDGTLCKVTSAIATGETITLGTNVTATTVMAEILALQTQGE